MSSGDSQQIMPYIQTTQRQSQAGFTLIELMFTLVVAAILLTLAVPNFVSMIHNNRIAAQANEFVAAINQARSEAAKQNRNGFICISSNQTACTGSDWGAGWLVWVDNNGNGTLDAGETVGAYNQPVGTTLLTASGGETSIGFTSNGFKSTSGTATFSLKTSNCKGSSSARVISINATGRTAIDKASCP